MADQPHSEPKPLRPPEDKLATEYLANERTFLAWIRTSIAVISLGFVIAKFSIWIRDLAARLDPNLRVSNSGHSLWIGTLMIAFGGLLPLLAAWRYHVVNAAIEQGRVKADRPLVVIITTLVFLLGIAMVVYLIVTANRGF